MKKKILICALALIPLTGCGLTRYNAKSQIEKATDRVEGFAFPTKFFPFHETTTFFTHAQIGKITGDCPNDDWAEHYVSSHDEQLVKAGLLTIQTVNSHTWDVRLTAKGKYEGVVFDHTGKGDFGDYAVVFLPLTKVDHVEITGIAEDGAHAKVEALYYLRPSSAGCLLRRRS
jgi:hypothetical protein